MKRENIKRNIATIALVATLVAGGTGIAIDKSIDHTEDYCPFCNVLGMEHQVNVINNSKKYENYRAKYVHDYNTTYTTNPIPMFTSEGVVYYAPAGYKLVANSTDNSETTYVAEKDVHYDDCVVVLDDANKLVKVITKR